MKQAFINKTFGEEAQAIVTIACEIITDYESQGYKLSLRQLYYQLVARNVVPNTEKSYKRVGDIIADARMAGMCDWDMIEDRNRETITPNHWNSPAEIIDICAEQYRIDKWETQPNYCEVMVEKQALEGVLEPVCRELDVPFTSNKGYSSVTMMYHAGRRMLEKFRTRCRRVGLMPDEHANDSRGLNHMEWLLDQGHIERTMPLRLTKQGIKAGVPHLVVFYLGDHDPSGIDMTRDVEERLRLFSDFTPIEVRRLALNMPQIEELNPPENPAKMTDSRAEGYVARFGHSSWELDAVAPDALADIVRTAIEEFRDEDQWGAAIDREQEQRDELVTIANGLKPKPKRKGKK